MAGDLTQAHAAKARAAKDREAAITQEVERLLSDGRVNDELKRKLQYCQEALAGRWPRSDTGLMATRRRELIREASRGG